MWLKMNLLFGSIAVFLIVILGTTEAGTVYKTIIKNGTGPVPQNNQTVVVHYIGKLQNGNQFDSSRDRNEAFKFKLGAGEVIRGWDAGVATMRVGERSELEIAPEDGYGTDGYPPVIPRSATLLFDIELLAIEGITPMPSQSSFGLVEVLTGGSSQPGFSPDGGQFVPGTVFAADSGQLGAGNGFAAGGGQSGPGTGFDTTNVFDNQGFNSGSFGTPNSQGIDASRPSNSQGFGGMGTDMNQGFVGMGSGSAQSFSSPSFTQTGSRLPSGATRSSGGGLPDGSSFGTGTSTQTAFGGSPTSSFDFSRSASTGRSSGSRMSLPDSFSAPSSGGGSSGSLRNPFQAASMDGSFDFGSSGAGAALFGSQGGTTGSFSMGGSTGRSSGSSFGEPSFDTSMTGSFEPSMDSRFGAGGGSAVSGRDFSRDRSTMNTGSRSPGMDMSIGSRDFPSGSMEFGRSSDNTRFDRFASAERGRSFSSSGSSGRMEGTGRMRSASNFLNMEFGGRGSSPVGTGGMGSGMGMRMGSGFGETDSSAGRRGFGRGMRSDRFGGMTLDAGSDRSRERTVGADRRNFRGDTRSGIGGRGTSGSGVSGGMGSMIPGMTEGMVPMGPQGAAFGGMSPGMRSSGFMPGMGSSMTPGMRPGMAPGMRPGMAPGMRPGMAPGMRPGMTPGMAPGMSPRMAPGMAPGMARMGPPGMGTLPGMMRPGMVPPFRRPRMSPFTRRGGRRRRRMMRF